MKPLRILVVDDNAIVGMLLGELLRSMGHDVCGEVRTEVDAVAAALLLRPDLMIVDARLGSGSGVAAVEAVLRMRHIPHIFMSGAPVQTGTAGGTVLNKPFLEADLAAAIEGALAAKVA